MHTYKNFLLIPNGTTQAVSARALLTQSTADVTCLVIPQNAATGATAQTASLSPGKILPLAIRSINNNSGSGIVLLW